MATLFKKRRAPSRLEELIATTAHYRNISAAPMLAAAVASFVTTFNGVQLITQWLAASDQSADLVALMISFVAAGVSFASWIMTINFLRLYQTGRSTAVGLTVLVYLFCITALSSTYTSFISMTQASARGLYLMEAAREYSSYASALRMRVVELENASAFIIPEAEDACTKAQTELTTGLISGSRGTGPVASKLQSLCTRKSAMADAIQQTLESTTPLVADIRQRSRQIDLLVLDTSLSLSEREIAFIGLARTLEGQLEDLRATDRMRSIRASYDAIGLAVRELDVLKSTVSPGQANALTEIIASENASSLTMAGMIDQIEAKEIPAAVRAELIPAPKITLLYASDHLPQLALAVSLDAFGPISALLFFAAGMRPTTNRKQKKGA